MPEQRDLEAKKEWINELNVFPVPDGDTGTNMTMTIMSAAREVAACEEPDHGFPGEGNFFRFPARRKRKLRRYLIPAVPRIYQGDQGKQRL